VRAVVQRVRDCSVTVAGRIVGSIPRGLLVYLGVGRNDGPSAVPALVDKVVNLRIFPDEAGKMNLSVKDTAGAVLVVPQFTLFGDVRGGRRPSYTRRASCTRRSCGASPQRGYPSPEASSRRGWTSRT
jgi:D-tyrosyl-tRNA(Tyr) deacylase